MSIKTDSTKIIDTKTKIENLKKQHEDYFTKIKLSNPQFCPKMAYFDSGIKVISFWPNELEKGEDIYTEFVNRNYESEDETRTLYKWKYNPFYKTEYKVIEPVEENKTKRYLIPIDELIVCKSKKEELFFEQPIATSSVEDLPIGKMTIRDFTAIMTGKPVSNKEWLNKIVINK